MTKPVPVFRSGVIADPRYTVRLDENSRLVPFPSLSWHITSWAISASTSATWPVEASRSRCYRPGSGMWLVVVGWLPGVSGSIEAGSGWSHSNPQQQPSTIYRGSICYRHLLSAYLEAHFMYNWGSGFLIGPLE
jgi:hypothetical protein